MSGRIPLQDHSQNELVTVSVQELVTVQSLVQLLIHFVNDPELVPGIRPDMATDFTCIGFGCVYACEFLCAMAWPPQIWVTETTCNLEIMHFRAFVMILVVNIYSGTSINGPSRERTTSI